MAAPDAQIIFDLSDMAVYDPTNFEYGVVYLTRDVQEQVRFPLLNVNHCPTIALVEVEKIYTIDSWDPEKILNAKVAHSIMMVYGYVMGQQGQIVRIMEDMANLVLHNLVRQEIAARTE